MVNSDLKKSTEREINIIKYIQILKKEQFLMFESYLHF